MNIKPSLQLAFAATRRLDPRITFTNASANRSQFDASGNLKYAGVNEPRFDHDPVTGESLGLLVEEARTNLLTYSEQFDNAAWTKSGGATITANSIASPDGLTTADTLTTASGGPNRVEEGIPVSTSTSYTMTVFVKQGDSTGVSLRALFSGGGTVDTYADFIFSSATFANINGSGTYTVTTLNNGWYRIGLIISSGTNTAVSVRIGGLITSAQTGTTTYIWGAQLEAGSFPTSYIPTVAASVTRSADVCSMTGTNFSSWYSQTEGTFVARFKNARGTTPSLISTDDGTASNRNIMYLNGDTNPAIRVVSGGVEQVPSVSMGAITAQSNFSVSVGFKLNDCAGSLNSASVVTDTLLTIPSGQIVFRIGHNVAVSSFINGHIARIVYFPRRLSNSNLQALST